MNNQISLLITIFNGDFLVRAALKVNRNEITDDALQYPLEPESQQEIKKKLWGHMRDIGPIVEVMQIFDVVDRSWSVEQEGQK